MAIGTITVVASTYERGGQFTDTISFAGDASYPTNGTATFQTSFRTAVSATRVIDGVEGNGLNGGYECIYDKAADKLLTVVKSSGVETANAVDLSGTTFKLKVRSH